MADLGGRPTVMDDLTLHKLEEAFLNDATDEQACFVANICPATLYNYQKEHPEFLERKQLLKGDLKYKAKLKIKEAILNEDKPLTSQWYLERKDKDFKPKQDLTSNDEALNPVLVKIIDDKGNNNRDTGGISETV